MALEHTFGAWSTTLRPTSWLNSFEQNVKELFFHRSELYLNEAAGAALRTFPRSGLQNPTLYAGGSATRADGTYFVHFTAEELHPDPQQQLLRASDGQTYAFQCENDELAQFVAHVPLQSRTLSSFELVATPGTQTSLNIQVTQDNHFLRVETAAWHLHIDRNNGSIRSLSERASGREWINKSHTYGFGQLVHEQVIHPWDWKAVGNTQRLLALDIANEQLKQSYPDEPVFERSTFSIKDEPQITSGALFDEIKFSCSHPPFGPVWLAWRFYHALPLIELVIDWHKHWSNLPEAAYVTFPFSDQHTILDLETGGGFFRPGSHETGGQLPGTCSRYYTIQRAARVTRQDGAQGFWLPVDAPLVMTNELNFNRWETEPWQWNGFLASMPVNHYWHTNFPTSQRGPLRLRYRFISQQETVNAEQTIGASWPVEALGWLQDTRRGSCE